MLKTKGRQWMANFKHRQVECGSLLFYKDGSECQYKLKAEGPNGSLYILMDYSSRIGLSFPISPICKPTLCCTFHRSRTWEGIGGARYRTCPMTRQYHRTKTPIRWPGLSSGVLPIKYNTERALTERDRKSGVHTWRY